MIPLNERGRCPLSKLTEEAPETHSLRCRGLQEKEIHLSTKLAFETDSLIGPPVLEYELEEMRISER